MTNIIYKLICLLILFIILPDILYVIDESVSKLQFPFTIIRLFTPSRDEVMLAIIESLLIVVGIAKKTL